MPALIDAHVHIYPHYNLQSAFLSAYRNLSQLEVRPICRTDAVPLPLVLFLTEKSGCNFYRQMCDGTLKLPEALGSLEILSDSSLSIKLIDGGQLFVIPGRQIVSKERVEVHAIGADLPISDGAPAREIIHAILTEGACPVLPWSSGKWLFGRGALISKLISEFERHSLALSDCASRSWAWGSPHQFREAEKRSFIRLTGTDPLPLSGEEQRIGSYAVGFSGDFDVRTPRLSVLKILKNAGAHEFFPVGRRQGFFESAVGTFKLAIRSS